jgi:hypothetical protein
VAASIDLDNRAGAHYNPAHAVVRSAERLREAARSTVWVLVRTRMGSIAFVVGRAAQLSRRFLPRRSSRLALPVSFLPPAIVWASS